MTPRGAVEGFLRALWRDPDASTLLRATALALRPASWVYRGGLALRELAEGEAVRVDAPVVSVGNLAVGGTGKTPLAAWVAARFAAWDVRPAVVLRGYGGDEVALHRRWLPGGEVVAHPDRVRAARQAVDAGARALVLDDGFQHRRLHRDLDVVLLAAEDPFPAPLLPAGPYREAPQALARAQVVVVTRRAAGPEAAQRVLAAVEPYLQEGTCTARVTFRGAGWRDLEGRPVEAPEGPVVALAGVARPETFARALEDEGIRVARLLAPGDHRPYHRRHVARIVRTARGRTVVTTAKDAVRLEAWASRLGDVRVRHESVHWEYGVEEVETVLKRVVGVAP